MQKISLSTFLALLLFSAPIFADSSGSAQYAGLKEWKSPNLGEEPDGEGVKVADVDGDGKMEIVAIPGGSIYIFKHDGMTYQEVWRRENLATPLDDLAIGDTDKDGRLEIIVSTMEAGNTRFYVFGFDGSSFQLEWQSNLFSGDGYDGLLLYTEDTDSDGSPEIVVISDKGDNNYVWIFDHDGTGYQEAWASGLLDTYDVGNFGGLSNTDYEDSPEIIFVGARVYIVGWNGTSYRIEWQSEVPPGGGIDEWAVGDVNGDATAEIVVVGEEGNIQIYEFDGSTYVRERQSIDIKASEVLVGDVDDDGIQEIVFASAKAEIYIFGYDGNSYQLEWQTSTPNPFDFIEKIENFDGHGGMEILVQEQAYDDCHDETGFCDVFTYDGETYRHSWRDEKLDSYFGGLLEPAGDVDNDGVPEEVRFANNESRYYPYSIYVIGPAKQMPSCSGLLKGDINGDCKVDLRDFTEMAENWLECNLIAQDDCWK